MASVRTIPGAVADDVESVAGGRAPLALTGGNLCGLSDGGAGRPATAMRGEGRRGRPMSDDMLSALPGSASLLSIDRASMTTQRLSDLRLRIAEGLDTRLGDDGVRLLKNPPRATYLALTPEQARSFDRFAGGRTVQSVLHELLSEADAPEIRAFYDLVAHAVAHGFLVEDDPASAAVVPGAPRARRWPFGWGLRTVLGLAVFALLGLWSMVRSTPLLPVTAGDWLVALLVAALLLSVGEFLKGCVLRGFGRDVYTPAIGWHFGLPVFTIDTRDAFMGGRGCEVSVALQALLTPFLAAAIVFRVGAPSLVRFAVCIAALMVTSPFGPTPAHCLLHALCRKSHRLPRCAATFLGRKLLQHLFMARGAGAEDEYLLSTAAWALAWLGAVVWFAAGLVQRQGTQLLDDLLFAPSLLIRLTALAVLLVLAGMLFMPLAYQVWLVLRNAFTMVAPRWFKAETRVRRRTTGTQPSRAETLEFLRSVPLFATMPESDLDSVASHMRLVHVTGRTTILREGDLGDTLFVIHSGIVAVSREDAAGVRHDVATLGTGDVFGEIALVDSVPRTATVRSVGAVALFSIAREPFDRLLVGSLGAREICTLIQVCAFLKRNALFAAWPDKALQEFAREFQRADFRPGEILIEEGRENHFFFLVYEGGVEVRHGGVPIRRLGAGEFFGEVSLLKGIPAVASVVAVTAGRCLRLERQQFLRFISHDAHTGVRVEETLEARLGELGSGRR